MELNSLASLVHRELRSERTGEKFSLSATLTESMGFNKLFVHHEILPPGRRASSPHSHSLNEELIFVLEGHPTAVLNDKRIELAPGGFIGFHPGTGELHYLENTTEQEVRVLVAVARDSQDQVTYSPYHIPSSSSPSGSSK